MLEYASIRFTESCRPAIRLATVIVMTASQATAGGHPLDHDIDRASPKTVSSTRSSIAKPPLFTAIAMYAVAGVGAPSYASGVHMWNGTALTLNARPTRTRTSATTTMGYFTAPLASAVRIPARSVCPVTP